MILAILGVIIVVILGLIGWCIFRFFKKKKPKGAEEKGKEDDENALVDNEEANAEEVSLILLKSSRNKRDLNDVTAAPFLVCFFAAGS